jgi:solute carrier family 8 (sodium/calcium exchanger)
VTVFTVCAIITISLIYARRYMAFFGKAELGGPTGPKWISGLFIFSLWIFYIVLASMQNYGHIKGF